MECRQSPVSRERRIARALAAIERRVGSGVVERLRAHRADSASLIVSSGSLALDRATRIGGLPRGHLSEYAGPESSGKSTLLYAALAAAQRAGGYAALVDAEGSADAESLRACGVDTDALLLARPASATDALLLLAILAGCHGFDALGLTSIPALRDLPAGRLRLTADDHTLAAPDLGRLLSRALRVLTANLAGSPTAIIATNEPLAHAPERAAGPRSPTPPGGRPGCARR